MARAALCALVVAYLVAAYQPFRWQAPWTRNTLAVSATGALRFDGTALARSRAPLPWVEGAIADGELAVHVEARTVDADQEGPARLLTVSAGIARADVMLAQQGDDLVVRLRRPGASDVGTPAIMVDGVFGEPEWRAVVVRVADGRAEVEVDGATVVTEVLGPDPLRSWNGAFGLALGNEIDGTRGWTGELRRATVQVGATTVDHLAAFEVPSGWLRKPLTQVTVEPSDVVANVVGFLPFGAVIVLLRPGRRVVLRAAGASAVMSATMEVGQLALVARDPSVLDLALNTAGGVIGAACVVVVAAGRRRAAPGVRSVG